MTTPEDAQRLDARSISNLREVGGITADDGVALKRGVLFRSGQLDRMDADSDAVAAGLQLRTIADLRTEVERAAAPDAVPEGVSYFVFDVLADMPGLAPAQIQAIFDAPAEAAEVLASMDIETQIAAAYEHLVMGENARAGYRGLLELAAEETNLPLLFHCTAGKDRTGWAATVLMMIAGVSADEAAREFLAVNPAVTAMFAPLFAKVVNAGLDPELFVPILEVRPSYLAAAFSAVEANYGTFDAYLCDGLGVSDDTVAAVRANLREQG